jgi:hypothetical protein
MTGLEKWCVAWGGRPPHVPDSPPVPVDGNTNLRLCAVCDKARRAELEEAAK